MGSSLIKSLTSRTRALLIGVALCIGPAAVLPAFADDETQRRPRPDVPSIAWGSCGAGFPNVQCANVEVPLDYNQPKGEKTTLLISRFPASNPAQKIGTLFLNPGGPGGSGVDLILFGFGEFLNQTLAGRFDIVGWDPRGVAGSTPLQCWDSNQAVDDYFAKSPAFPYQPQQERPYYELNKQIYAICAGREQNRKIIRHMSTADVVRDLDLLRQAVGDERLTYLGYSYGSHIGNTYANLFPSKVRALVIDGVLDPILWTSGWQIKADRTASFETLKEFFKQCDQSSADDCPLRGPSGAKARFDALLDNVRRATIIIGEGADRFEYSYDAFVADSAGVMYSPDIWPLYASFLDALNDIVIGVPSAPARALQGRRALEKAFSAASPRREIYQNGTEAYYGNQCSDTQYPSEFPLYSWISKYAEAGSFQGPYWWWGNTGCAAWPTARDRYIGPWVTRTAAPVLVVGNYFDPATDYAGAVSSSRLLFNSRLLSYAGWGHTAAYSGRSACVDNYVTQYLLDGSLPPDRQVCPTEKNPFASTANNARTPTRAPVQKIGLPTLKPLPKI
jgi:pimeloyl-ACP methyl ester carboxylesterase